MKKLTMDRQGLTLLEIILALALLSIVVVSFMALFSGGFVTILAMGQKSRAGVEAQMVLDRTNAEAVFTDTTELRQSVTAILTDAAIGTFEDYTIKPGDFNEANTNDTKVRFMVGTEDLLVKSGVPVLTVQVYYNRNRQSITISSPIVR